MLWLIFQFYKFFFKFFRLKKIQLMIEKYFPIFFFLILTKVKGNALIFFVFCFFFRIKNALIE